MKNELFFEIGTEEIPSRFLKPAIDDIGRLLEEKLTESRIGHGEIVTTATPRRLVGCVREVADRQSDLTIEKAGPPWASAFDESGKPTKVAEGFAKSMDVDISELRRVSTDKGDRVGVVKTVAGQPTSSVLPDLLRGLFASIPWQKSMRWGSEPQRFVRPVQWLVARYDGKPIPLEFAGVAASDVTYGHRFHAPKQIRVKGFDDYVAKLRDRYVLVMREERRRAIAEQLKKAARSAKGRVIEDEKLLDEVTGLVEWPVVHVGHVPDEYMELPREVLLTPMREHQRYFGFEAKDGELLGRFAAVGNVEASDPKVVKAGYERVLNARLADARFFYRSDLAQPLDDLAQKLDQVVFHRRLGTYKEKVLRAQAICRHLADRVAPASRDTALHALWLAKADLLSKTVFEFPELQGVMGRIYARHQGEKPEVCEAIFEHYLPRFAGDVLPSSDVGALCSVSDKMDSVVACLGVGLAPTGAGDPYALRRQAQGIVQIVLDRKWSVSLPELIRAAAEASREKTGTDTETLVGQTLEFFRARLAGWLKQGGMPADVVDAVLAVRFDDPVEVAARCEAVVEFSRSDDYAAFATAFKRVANIVGDYTDTRVDPAAFTDDAERRLHDAVIEAENAVSDAMRQSDVAKALLGLAAIRPTVDRFFDSVMVMDENEERRRNRLSLLTALARLFGGIADFRRL
ncbi:MAG: glycine--tRNA ligase subunit beta [Deltaproteobacteria bacterium]|nr:glycine--tRNA ligase subunit beta [Deltaproteobacteria bacterium]